MFYDTVAHVGVKYVRQVSILSLSVQVCYVCDCEAADLLGFLCWPLSTAESSSTGTWLGHQRVVDPSPAMDRDWSIRNGIISWALSMCPWARHWTPTAQCGLTVQHHHSALSMCTMCCLCMCVCMKQGSEREKVSFPSRVLTKYFCFFNGHMIHRTEGLTWPLNSPDLSPNQHL